MKILGYLRDGDSFGLTSNDFKLFIELSLENMDFVLLLPIVLGTRVKGVSYIEIQ